MTQDTQDSQPVDSSDQDLIDENMQLFIYGNLTIRDVDTGEILVNQRF